MYRRGIVARLFLTVILVAVLVAGGALLFRSGWAQGYQAGSLLSSGEVAEALPIVPQFRGQLYGPYMPGFGFPFFGLCLSIGFIFLIMFLIGGIFKPWGRRRWAGHHAEGVGLDTTMANGAMAGTGKKCTGNGMTRKRVNRKIDRAIHRTKSNCQV
jgi:hypothetical protein